MGARLRRLFRSEWLRKILDDSDVAAGHSQTHYRTIFILSTILMVATLGITVMNWFSGSPGMFAISAFLGATFFTTNLMIYKRVPLRYISTIICVVLAIAFSLLIVSGGNQGFAITWVFLIPCSISLLFGMTPGLLISGFFFLFFTISFYTPLHTLFLFTYPDIVRTRFPILYGCFFLVNTIIQVQLRGLRLNELEARRSLEAAVRAKSDFLAKMSHEIRTPMNAVMGLSELVLRGDLPQDVYENVLMIRNASANLLSIINDILDFSKVESGRLEIIEADYQLPSLVNDVINIIRVRLVESPVRFAVRIDPTLPLALTGDETRIRQVLINLLSNALKYTHSGHIGLSIRGTVSDAETVMLSMAVTDTGVGIKEADLGKLFGDFVQINTEMNKGIEGTGLGLAIARSLCRAMGGDITVTSQYQKGSVFTVELPQKICDPAPFASVEQPGSQSVALYEPREVYRDSVAEAVRALGVGLRLAQTPEALLEAAGQCGYAFIASSCYADVAPALMALDRPPKLVVLADASETLAPKEARTLALPAHSLSVANLLNDVSEDHGHARPSGASFTAPEAKVLLVDDIAANLRVAEGLMMPFEMQVTLCSSGREAVALIAQNSYDLVFMDHMMPDLDGLEATQLVRAMEGERFAALPIIALTANALSGMREMYLQSGMNDFLTKPIEMVKLGAILERWIPKEKRRLRAAPAPEQALAAPSPFIEAACALPQLDVRRAIDMAGGMAETYERTLKLSVRLLPDNLASLRTYIDQDLSRYRIEVHGVKGVLGSIGAYALSDAALTLERLAQKGDAAACRSEHPAFIERLAAFSDAANALLDQFEVTEKPPGDRAELAQALPELEEALGFFDCVRALSVLEPLAAYTYGEDLDGLLAELSRCLQHFDLDSAETGLASLRARVPG